jgi:hypothetical protein
MTDPVTVRAATEQDLGPAAEIIAADTGSAADEWRDRFAAALADPDRYFLVAVQRLTVVTSAA